MLQQMILIIIFYYACGPTDILIFEKIQITTKHSITGQCIYIKTRYWRFPAVQQWDSHSHRRRHFSGLKKEPELLLSPPLQPPYPAWPDHPPPYGLEPLLPRHPPPRPLPPQPRPLPPPPLPPSLSAVKFDHSRPVLLERSSSSDLLLFPMTRSTCSMVSLASLE